MRKFLILLSAGMLFMGGGVVKAQDVTTMQTCEYWIDYDFEHRQQAAIDTSGLFQQQFDVASLSAGLHSLGFRFADSRGRWGAPFVKHFTVTSRPETAETARMQTCEYWIDYDFENRQQVAVSTEGRFQRQFDVTALSPGLHSLGFRFADSRDRWGAPFVKHFIIPSQPEPAIMGIAAYEYWFNKGPRVRVEVEPQQRLTLSDVAIELKDITPNAVTQDYRFNAAEETVYCPDNVTFGIQAFDNLGHPSSAVSSEVFAYDVAVNPHFVTLTSNEPAHFASPVTIQGFRLMAAVGDSIWVTLNKLGQLDLYDAEGNAVERKTEDAESSPSLVTYQAVAPTTMLYALLWNVPLVMDDMEIVYQNRGVTNSIASPQEAAGAAKVCSGKSHLTITVGSDSMVEVYTYGGTEVLRQLVSAGSLRLNLPASIYLVRINGKTVKAIVQ